ncbi:MAG TPA: hypothetical protein VMV83_14235 [Rectinemataceae bacterium]|nr:hypothetical protein [Rectinemataceae bacterium]
MRRLLSFLAVTAVALGGIYSQQLPLSATGSSASSLATGGIVLGDKDYFLDPSGYSALSGAELFLQYGMPGADALQSARAAAALPLGPFYLGLYAGAKSSSVGNSAGTTATGMSSLQNWTTDASGNLLSVTTTANQLADWTDSADYALSGLFGMKLGGIPLGIFNSFEYSDSTRNGDFQASYSWATTGAWNSPTLSAPSGLGSTSTTVKNGSGTTLDSITSAYGSGYDKGSLSSGIGAGFTDSLVVGADLGIAGFDIKAKVGSGLSIRDRGALAQYQSYEQRPGQGYAAYTPPSGAGLPGTGTISDAFAFSYYEATDSDSPTTISPLVDLRATLPVPGFSMPATLEVGAVANLGFTLHSASYTDSNGATTAVAGFATSYGETDLSTTIGTGTNGVAVGQIGTTKTAISYWQASAYSADSTQSYSLPVVLRSGSASSDPFGFGVGLTPTFSLSSTAYTTSGEAVKTTNFDNGNGLVDPGDYVTTETVVRGGSSVSLNTYSLDVLLSTGAWFYVKPNALRVNLGGSATWSPAGTTTNTIATNSVTSYTSSTLYGGSTSPVTTSYLTSNPGYQLKNVRESNSLGVTYSAGMTYFFSKAMYLDLYYVGNHATTVGTSTGSLFEPGSWTLEMTIKP